MARERIFSIDALRGFSLLGIILMNILTFAYPYQVIRPFEFSQHLHCSFFRVSSLFIVTSFYPLFVVLIAAGLSSMCPDSIKLYIDHYPMLIRRLLSILLLGVIDGIFLFYGD